MFDPLLNSTGKGVITGRLAETYTVADDLKSITFNLRKNVKFIDGTPFNAQAAKWNLDKQIATKQYPYWGSVDVVNDYTIKVNLTSWVNTIVSSFTSQGTWMISPTAFDKNGEEWARNNPTGTGPFKFSSFERDVNYKVVKNPDYWDTGKPILDAVTVLYISDSNTIRMAMEGGQADACQIEAGKTAVDLKAKGFGLQITIGTVMCMLPDTAHSDSILANKKVREAIEYAIDRDAIAKAFSYGLWEAPYQIPPASSMGFNPNFALARKYDPDKARQLLTEAGYPNGLTITLGWPPLSLDMNVALAVQADLAKVGITLTIDAVSVLPQYFDNTNKAHDELFFQPVFSGANWNAALALSFAPSQQMMNMAWGRDAKFIELYNKSMASKAPDAQLMWDVSNYLTSEAEAIPVICGASAYCTASYVKDGGWYMTAADYNPATLWIDK
jgi:peptide/nickel transport system substrate-binding protein